MDAGVYTLARTLLDDLSALLELTRAGHPGLAVVHPGDQVPQYGCPLAAVRVARVDPVGNVRTSSRCQNPLTAVILEMTVDRCYTTPADNAMPPLGVLDSHSRDLADDAAAMRHAALCFHDTPPTPVLGAWTPRGPRGGIVGGSTLVSIHLDHGCGCDTPDEAWPNLDTTWPMLPGDPRSSG